VVRGFLAGDAAVQVRDEAELERTLGDLLANESRRGQLGQNARKVVQENLGAMDRTVDMILKHLDEEVLTCVRGKSR
jgi:3-deoxy-D-manno-octulosonic-acid transferase